MPDQLKHEPAPEIVVALRRAGLVPDDASARFEELPGGISSEIWKVTPPDGPPFCVKRALAKLKVDADWFVPVERNRYEVAWNEVANRAVPGSAPEVIASDGEAMLFAMPYPAPDRHEVWKEKLRDGRVEIADAEAVGRRLAAIHAATAGDAAVAERFPPNDIFRAIRLEPYLEAAAQRNRNAATGLYRISRRTAGIRKTMIHGSVSPQNILIGPDGPVLLDAECACLGDPAFDLAFCLNHLLLKCLLVPTAYTALIAAFNGLAKSYLSGVTWESPLQVEFRAATLLPGLLLARIDGRSPVEYVTSSKAKYNIRRGAGNLLNDPPRRLAQVVREFRRVFEI